MMFGELYLGHLFHIELKRELNSCAHTEIPLFRFIRPPPVSSFSKHFPGNDSRYQKYLTDVRYSVRESVIRSIEGGDIILQRKLPKSESLKDCMERTIPYFAERIIPDAVQQGKRVLISSS